jgi:hypothetical protein
VIIRKARFLGDLRQLGNYTQDNLFRSLPSTGVLISSGRVVEVEADSGFNGHVSFNRPGDGDLDTVLKTVQGDYVSADAAVLLVEVEVRIPVTITVSYVFGSFDYPNTFPGGMTWFPDIFGVFLNRVHVTQIGGKPVSVATVYCENEGSNPEGLNCDQYISNRDHVGTALWGYTKTQAVTFHLPPGGHHQLKFAVADGGKGGKTTYSDAAAFLSFQEASFAPPF